MAYKNIALELFYKRYPDPLCLFDNILFAYAARHEDFVSYISNTILTSAGFDPILVDRFHSQHEIIEPALKEFIFDLLIKAFDGSLIAIEVQNKNDEFDYKREDLYMAALRSLISRGEGYKEIKDVFLIIINRHNPIPELNAPLYIASKSYNEIRGSESSCQYPTTIHIIRVNGGYEHDLDENLQSLIYSMKQTKAAKATAEPIKSILRLFEKDDSEKENIAMSFEEFEKYQKIREAQIKEESRQEGIAEGRAEGIAEEAERITAILRENGASEHLISLIS